MIEGPRLTALIASRVCHDMMGPMNAIIQGLEMIKETDANGKNADAISLMEHGVQNAWAKLEFFRFAFGSAVVEGEGELEEAKPTADRLFAALKPNLDWATGRVAMPRAAARVIMNLLLIGADCLPRGGTVRLESRSNGAVGEVAVIATGPRATLKADTLLGLRGESPAEGFEGHNIQPAIAGLFARQLGIELAAREAPERIELIARSAAFKV
jgi:histidine phosphotransferase ChpT